MDRLKVVCQSDVVVGLRSGEGSDTNCCNIGPMLCRVSVTIKDDCNDALAAATGSPVSTAPMRVASASTAMSAFSCALPSGRSMKVYFFVAAERVPSKRSISISMSCLHGPDILITPS